MRGKKEDKNDPPQSVVTKIFYIYSATISEVVLDAVFGGSVSGGVVRTFFLPSWVQIFGKR